MKAFEKEGEKGRRKEERKKRKYPETGGKTKQNKKNRGSPEFLNVGGI